MKKRFSIRLWLATALRRWRPLYAAFCWLRTTLPATVARLIARVLRSIPRRSLRLGPPDSYLSIADEVRSGQRRGKIVLETQGHLDASPDSMLARCGLHQHEQPARPIFWSEHRNIRLTTSSLALIEHDNKLALESIYGTNYLAYDPAARSLWLPSETVLPFPCTSVVSVWSPNGAPPNYSHWLLDVLPRLALLNELPPETVIIVQARLAGYQLETLQMLGLDQRIRLTGETHLRIKEFYFLSPTAMVVCYNPYAVAWLREQFLRFADKQYQGPKRFFMARDHFRGLQNEGEVYELFKRLGWTIMRPEELRFAEELQLFAEAEAICGVIGSGFTNTIWCKPGTKVVQIIPESVLDGSTEWICRVNQLEFHFLVCPADHMAASHVDLLKLQLLLEFAGLDSTTPV